MTPSHNIARSSLLTTAATVVTMLASFLSQVVIAKLFGASAELDAYLTAGALPLTISGVVMAAVGYVTIPILAEARGDAAEIERTIGHFLVLVLALAASIALAGSFFARAIVHWTAPNLRVEKLALAEQLQPFFWCATAAQVVASFLIGLHHFRRRFVWPSLSGALIFLSVIGAGLALTPRLGVRSIALGYAIGSAAQCAGLLLILRKGVRVSVAGFRRAWLRFAKEAVPVAGSLLPFTLLPVIDAYWAARLPDGSLSYIGYASRIILAATAISAHGVGMVLFPHMAENAARQEYALMGRRIVRTLTLIYTLLIPAALFVGVLRVPVLTLVFQRGQFTALVTSELAQVLPFYLFGMLGMAGMGIISRGFYSLHRSGSLAWIGLASLAGYAALSGFLSFRYSYIGIGISFAVYWTVQFAVATSVLGRRLGNYWRREDFNFLLKVAGAAFVTTAILLAFEARALEGLGRVRGTLTLGFAAVPLLLVSGFLILDSREVSQIASAIERGIRR